MEDHFPAHLGLVASILALIIFGENFILPAMIIILLVLYLTYRRERND
ncbi:hypothetical protein [Peptoniphilus harei]|nr:hypothetical protein [Peptoniphilus harei]MDU1643258.1 hypothetical protein [Peptoniphilus harei]